MSEDQWFPASHTYAVSGTYPITATAYNDLGDTEVAHTTAYVGRDTGEMILIPVGEFQMGCDDWPDCCVGDTSQVGDYPTGASPYGVMDMAGNVWEWANDWYQSDYYSVSPPSGYIYVGFRCAGSAPGRESTPLIPPGSAVR